MSTQKKKKPKVIHVSGRRWFQKSYGNTYHTAQIYLDGQLIHSIPKSYGYDSMYLQNAMEWLKNYGYLPKECNYPYTIWCRENGIRLAHEVSDVAREKDL